MERSLDFVILLDIYGELLANSQREALDMRYNADLSLAEIAEEMGGVTRQSVVSAIKKGEQRLEELEQKLRRNAQNGDTAFWDKLQQTGFETVSPEVFAKMADTQTPQGILTVLEQPSYDLTQLLEQPEPLFLILENLQDPGNLGTMIRTGEGAGITGVIMNQQTVDIFNPKTIRATMGSIFRVPFVYVPELSTVLTQIHERGIHTYAAHLKGQKYYDSFSFREPTAFLIGNEGNGLTKEISDQAGQYLKIPMEGKVESLNASIAAALLMYEAHRQRNL